MSEQTTRDDEKERKRIVAWKCTIGCLPLVVHHATTGEKYLTHDRSLCGFCKPINQSELTALADK